MARYKLLFAALFSGCILISYSFSGNPGVKPVHPMARRQADFPSCPEIDKYPIIFSYVTDDLKKELEAKCITPLILSEKTTAFQNRESFPDEIYSDFYRVFAVNKINYTTATLMIYLIEEEQTESMHETDRLLLVIYDKDGVARDVLSKNLQDVFSTREFKFTSNREFNVVDTDSEYSPDPESEAEDRRNGRAPEPSVSTLYYQVDPVAMKFKMLD
ncbi:hypothetical protein [Fluviicola sp.]|uniref:hypothetical protein n=1 Tax=Fluviicola sp. TaxID=1917219 RepID=UPI0031D0C515